MLTEKLISPYQERNLKQTWRQYFSLFFIQNVFIYMTLSWLIKSNPAVFPAFSGLGSDLFFLVGKGEMTPRLQLYYLLELIHHLKGGAEMRHFPRSHARSTTFEMQMSDKLNELWGGMNKSSLGRWHDQKSCSVRTSKLSFSHILSIVLGYFKQILTFGHGAVLRTQITRLFMSGC